MVDTSHAADVLLKLCELRTEPALRQARAWFTFEFHPATATIVGGKVKVSSPLVSAPVAVRFGWNQMAEPNLANKAGLPASPFRTDKWDDSAAPAFPGEKK